MHVLYSLHVVYFFYAAALLSKPVNCENDDVDSPLTLSLLDSASDKLSLSWTAHVTPLSLSYRRNDETEFSEIAKNPKNPAAFTIDSCSDYEFKLSSDKGNYFANFQQANRLEKYNAGFKVSSEALTSDGILVKLTFKALPAGFKPKFDLTAFSAASGAIPTVKVADPSTAEILIGGKNVERIQRGEPCWFIVILRQFQTSCGGTVALGSAENHHVLSVKCSDVKGMQCTSHEKSTSAYCYLPRILSVPLDENKILVTWKFDLSDETFPKAQISEYAIRYGPVVNTGEVTFKQKIDSEDIITVDPFESHTVLVFPIDCSKEYKIQICAVFDKKPDKKSWHLLNSHNLSTSMACRWDEDYLPSIDWFLENVMNLTRKNLLPAE